MNKKINFNPSYVLYIIFLIYMIIFIYALYMGCYNKYNKDNAIKNTIIAEDSQIVAKNTSNKIQYTELNGLLDPNFLDEYYFILICESDFIEIKVPYAVFNEHILGDHLFVSRNVCNYKRVEGFFEYVDVETKSDFKVIIDDIEIPAIVITDQYNNNELVY